VGANDNDGGVVPMVESLVINTNESDCCLCLNDNLAGLEPLAGLENESISVVGVDSDTAVNNQIIGNGNGHGNGAPVEVGALSTNFGQATIGCSSDVTQSESDNDGRVMPMVESLVINNNESECFSYLNDNLTGLEPRAGLENESISVVGVDSDTAVSKIRGDTGGVSRGQTGAEFVASMRGMYRVTDLEFTSSSEGESEMSSERSEDEMSSEGESHESLTIQGNVRGQTKQLESNIVKKDSLAKGYIEPNQVIADAQYNLFMVTEWLRLRRP